MTRRHSLFDANVWSGDLANDVNKKGVKQLRHQLQGNSKQQQQYCMPVVDYDTCGCYVDELVVCYIVLVR
jgi:hypothetical protein